MRFAIDLDAYLQRIDHPVIPTPDLAGVQALVKAHVAAIPFENLDPLMGWPVELDPAALEDKLVHRRRGGYCFEHNLLFAEVLQAIGLPVTGLIARVLWNRPEDALAAQTHMLLQVAIEGETWLVDVGFGGLSLSAPVRLVGGLEQATPHEPFRLLEAGGDWRMQAWLGDRWRSLYRFNLQPSEIVDYAVANHYVSTHPDSPFTSHLMAARTAAGRRLALHDRTFTVHHGDGTSEQRVLHNVHEIRSVLEREFLLPLPSSAALDRRLAGLPAA